MALVTVSALVSDIKGKVGGMVFQNTQAGLAVRQKVSPINRRTTLQTTSRLKMFNLQNAWMNLTDAQRADWDLFAQTYPKPQIKNPAKNINGQQYFLKCNDFRVRYGYDPLLDIDWNIPTLEAFTATIFNFGSNLWLLCNRRIDFANEFLVCFLSWEVSSGMNNPSNRRKMIIFSTNYWNDINITSGYSAIFGTIPATGSNVFIKVASFSKTSPYWTMFYEEKVTVQSTFGIGYYIVGSTFVVFP